jgi:hypothetical protein
MEGILKFNLPEEDEDFARATLGPCAIDALFEINSNVRRRYLKYGALSPEEGAIAEKIFEDISEQIPHELIRFL